MVLRWEDLPRHPDECNDTATYELLSRGDTLGVFQLDSAGMRGLLRQVRPERFADVAAVLALYRPGPMGAGAERSYANRKAGRERISYPHQELATALEPILAETYGLIVYQEQVLEILAAVADYTYGSAELIFNAMRKKQIEKMEAAKPDFIERMRRNSYSDEAIEALWDVLVPFADYSFNRSHSTGYAVVAYWTAYLKANHPAEYMAALLTNEPDNNKLSEYLAECERMGIDILPPDVNESLESFTPTDDGIRYGLASIKGVGAKAVTALVSKRPYKSLQDFYSRVPISVLNVGVLGALVRCGALDSLANREGHMAAFEALAEKATEQRRNRQRGMRGLIRPRYSVKDASVNIRQRQQWERDTLGVELSVAGVVIKPRSVLEPAAMKWLQTTFERYPGRQPVWLDLGARSAYYTGVKIDAVAARSTLEALGVTINEYKQPR